MLAWVASIGVNSTYIHYIRRRVKKQEGKRRTNVKRRKERQGIEIERQRERERERGRRKEKEREKEKRREVSSETQKEMKWK